jgi:membrane-bound lytic murein transglycosylase B
MVRVLAILLCSALLMLPRNAAAQTVPYAEWLQQLTAEAIQSGIAPQTVQNALSDVQPDDRVALLDQKQPEKTITFAAYVRNVVNAQRLAKARKLYKENLSLLRQVSQRYGVSPEIIVALWGIESNFGANMGRFNVINSLVTLAYEGRRAELFRRHLIAALRILDQEGMTTADLTGSWAGAMGQSQFMPLTYMNHAVDFDNDGHRDIWRSPADVFGSIANYLGAEGWQAGQTWGREVKLTKHLPAAAIGLQVQKQLADWHQLGVRKTNGQPLPQRDLSASLIQPDGASGRSFLVYDNFRALMRWNRSTYFATSVGLLADQIH